MKKYRKLNQINKPQSPKRLYLLHLKQFALDRRVIGSFLAVLVTSSIIHAVQTSNFKGRIEFNLSLDGVQFVVDNRSPMPPE
jgi:hypothetical protein